MSDGSGGSLDGKTSWPDRSLRHTYPIAIRQAGFATSWLLMLRTLPYAGLRFAILFGYTLASVVWLCVMVGGALWLGEHVGRPVGIVWFLLWLVAHGMGWRLVLRYTLHLIECGHVAVLTELIMHDRIGNGDEPMFSYGRRIVTQRFAETNALFALQILVRGIIQSFHRTLDWLLDVIPLPGSGVISGLSNAILLASTRYLDKTIFSYDLARNDTDPWRASRDGIIYYCQNAKPILQTALWVVVLDIVLSVVLWALLLIPASLFAFALQSNLRDIGTLVCILIAAALAANLRAAFLKPIFLTMIMVRFHNLAEGQVINPAWDERLGQVSANFGQLWGRPTAY